MSDAYAEYYYLVCDGVKIFDSTVNPTLVAEMRTPKLFTTSKDPYTTDSHYRLWDLKGKEVGVCNEGIWFESSEKLAEPPKDMVRRCEQRVAEIRRGEQEGIAGEKHRTEKKDELRKSLSEYYYLVCGGGKVYDNVFDSSPSKEIRRPTLFTTGKSPYSDRSHYILWDLQGNEVGISNEGIWFESSEKLAKPPKDMVRKCEEQMAETRHREEERIAETRRREEERIAEEKRTTEKKDKLRKFLSQKSTKELNKWMEWWDKAVQNNQTTAEDSFKYDVIGEILDERQLAEKKATELRRQKERKARIESFPTNIQECIKKKKVILGMTTEQVTLSWGWPEHINRSVGKWGEHEQWVYGSTYLYFENGIMTSFQESRR